MSLFVADSDDEGPPEKRQRIAVEEPLLVEVPSDEDDEVDDDSDIEWEDVLAYTPQDDFTITIDDLDSTAKEKSNKIRQLVVQKKRRITIHYLGMTTYMLFAHERNQWLSDKKVLKVLKKLLPDALLKRVKKLNKGMAQASLDKKELDLQFIYILKYLIKWFRLNFKIDSNGIRVLGYLPKKDPKDYFPNTSAPLFEDTFVSMIKRFKHNRDTASQIFTALLRSIGWESRMVFSLPLISPSEPAKFQPRLDHKKLQVNKDNDLLFPYFWTELVNPLNTSEILAIEPICFHDEEKQITRLKRFGSPSIDPSPHYTPLFYPVQSQFNQMTMHYVISLSNSNSMFDVSSRYMQDVAYRWFNKLDLRTEYGRAALLFQSLLRHFNRKEYSLDEYKELDCLRKTAMINLSIPKSLTALKRNPNLLIQSTLRYNEVISPDATPLKTIKIDRKKYQVYFKNSVTVGKSENQWKFLGRSIIPHEIDNPIKLTRALTPRTIHNKRAYIANVLNGMSELNETKLYSFAQTCAYIKPIITTDEDNNRILPRNKYGNLEVFKTTMVPDDCVWIKLAGIELILQDYKFKRLKTPFDDPVQYVPVVVGFNFHNQKAIPVKKGVMVLKEQAVIAKKIWFYAKSQMSNKNTALSTWKKLLHGLRISERLDETYGET